MDELWLILVFFYLGATLFGRAMKKARGQAEDAAEDAKLEQQRADRAARREAARRAARTRPPVIVSAPPPPEGADAGTRGTQGEARALEALFRGMGIEIELPGGEPMGQRRFPPPRPPLPAPEDPEEARSLEGQSVEGEALDVEPGRAARTIVVADAAAEEVVRRRIEAAEARSHALGAADHAEFHRRVTAAPRAAKAHAAISLADLRRAVVWREVLGPPLALRDLD